MKKLDLTAQDKKDLVEFMKALTVRSLKLRPAGYLSSQLWLKRRRNKRAPAIIF